MGSLIYRELYISRKFYITNILVFLLFIVMGILVRLSMLYGNLANFDAEVFELTDNVTYYLFTYLAAYAAFSIVDDTGVILSDLRSNWHMFSYTLPVTPEKHVLVKYIIKLGAFCTAMVIAIINGAIIGAFAGRGFGMQQILNFFLFANFWLLVNIIRMPVMLASRTEKGFQMAHWGFIIPLAAIMLPIMKERAAIMAEISTGYGAGALTPEQQQFIFQQRIMEYAREIYDKILSWMPLLTAVLIVLGFVICIQCMKRREK